MGIAAKAKRFALDKTINAVLDLATRPGRNAGDIEKTVIRGLGLAAKLTRDELWSAVVKGIKQRFEEGHPMKDLCVRFLTQLNREARHRIVRNLFIDEALMGNVKRHKLEEKLGFYPPGLIAISPTMSCPLHCYGCYASEYPKDEALSFEQVDGIIRQAKDIGIKLIIITGGEPYYWEPLFDIFEKHNDCTFQTYTSGLLITDEMVEKLAELGNVIPAISNEGFEKETDERRGKGAFRKIKALMAKLKDKGLPFGFSATATRENLDVVSSDEYVEHWMNAGCLFGWYFIYMPIGRSPKLELMPTPEQRARLGQRVRDMRSRKPIMVMDFWNDGEPVGGCIAGGRKYLHVNNKGDYETCVFCHFAKDNIKDKTLVEALQSDFFTEFRSRQPFNEDLRRPCVMIDNPYQLREIVAKTGADGTHPGATTMINEFAEALDKYAEEFGEVLKGYEKSKFKLHA
ncbi:MAG: radical SAM protein [Planctomycetota bacterium]|nr:MAG: radical SAM protein [Planctomycetota bacterium]